MTGKIFVYKNVRLSNDRKVVNFDYELKTDEKSFSLSEELVFPESLPTSSVVDRLLRSLHLALGISYYKTLLPPVVDHDYTMDIDEADFWNTVFTKGLGEFLHNNGLSAGVLAKFGSQKGSINPAQQDDIGWNETALLGIGGGKDSIVAGELLKSAEVQFSGFVLATGENEGQSRAVADKMNVDLLPIKRTIDPQIHEINKLDGAYNGHVPVSLIFALTGCLLATIRGNKYIVVGNESSASIPQLQGSEINVNHQWSKSFEFEKLFIAYLHTHISPELHYFSAVRPLSSLAVAKLFANFPVYFEVFSSDNSHFKMNSQPAARWSVDSPKSLSSYILLAPWLDDESLQRIFGARYLENEDLSEMFTRLLGLGHPVLDCVGTPQELQISLSLLIDQNRMTDAQLMILAREKGLIGSSQAENLQKLLELGEHAIPQEMYEKLSQKIKEQL